MQMSFDEFITMKGLQLKASVSGRGGSGGVWRLLERDTEQMEKLGLKNMCFRIDPMMQARLEETIHMLDISKQELLTEMLWETLNRIDDQLEAIGVGKVNYENRLRELGYEFGAEDEEGNRALNRVTASAKE